MHHNIEWVKGNIEEGQAVPLKKPDMVQLLAGPPVGLSFPDDLGGYPGHKRIGRYVFHDQGVCGNDGLLPDGDAGHDDGAGIDLCIILDDNGMVFPDDM